MAALTNGAWNNLSAAKDRIIGPSYSYTDNIPRTSDLGIGENGDFGQISTNVRGAFKYVDIMGYTQKPLGDSYLIDTGGMCISPSGILEPRKAFVSNIPKGGALGKGLVGGVMDDVFAMNPVNLYKAMKAGATPPCQKYKCQVTNGSNGDTAYITPSLSPDFDGGKCSAVAEPANPDAAQIAEITRLTGRVKEVKTLVANNPDNKTYKKELVKLQSQLEDAQSTLAGMKDNRASYESQSKETFQLMNTSAFGGILLAGILLALVFRR
jgi:hypothetical protein